LQITTISYTTFKRIFKQASNLLVDISRLVSRHYIYQSLGLEGLKSRSRLGTRGGSPIGAAVLQHPQSFPPKKIKIKKLGMKLVKYSGIKNI